MHYNGIWERRWGYNLNCENDLNPCVDEKYLLYEGTETQDVSNVILPNHFISPKDKQGVLYLYPIYD